MHFNYFSWFFLLTWPSFYLLYAFPLARIWIYTTSLLNKAKYNVTHLDHPVLEGNAFFSFFLFCCERCSHSYNLSNQQPGLVFCDPTGKIKCNSGFALVPITSKRSIATWGHCCQLYLHGATFWQAERSHITAPKSVSWPPALKAKGKARGAYAAGSTLWEHMCLRLERCECEDQKWKLQEKDLACILFAVLYAKQSGVPFSLLSTKTQKLCKHLLSDLCHVEWLVMKELLEKIYFKIF